jgi:hypothetical protein
VLIVLKFYYTELLTKFDKSLENYSKFQIAYFGTDEERQVSYFVNFQLPCKVKLLNYTVHTIQSVPLATEPGISLIILPLMRILQRNLKRTYLIV